MDATERPKVLIVDDDPRIRTQVEDALEAAVFITLSAADALDAYSILNTYTDLALMVVDIRIPGRVDGILFAQVAAERSPRTPIIVISGEEKPEWTAMPSGATFLRKPFRAEEIVKEARLLVA